MKLQKRQRSGLRKMREIFKIDKAIDIELSLPEKIERSLEILDLVYAKCQEQEVPMFVNFSGGKDSSACLLLAREIAGDKVECIFMSTLMELPGTVEFVKQEAERLKVTLHITDPIRDYMGDFSWWVRHYGYFPSFGYNFCNSRLKIRASRRYLRKIHGLKTMFRLNGVRQQESSRRKKMYKESPFVVPDGDLSGSYIVYPILEWTGDNIKEYLSINNFEVHKQYSAFGVSGCAYCPFYQKDIYFRILNAYPDIYDELIKLEDEIGKPAVSGNLYLKDIKAEFMANPEGIMERIGAPSEKIKRCKALC